MNSIKSLNGVSTKALLSTLWIFLMFNYTYGDILTLMNPAELKMIMSGKVGPIKITEGFLLQAAIFMEISIVMVILSRVLNYSANRWANIIAAFLSGAGLFASFFVGNPAPHYIFLAIIEFAGIISIIWIAWTWKKAE